VKTDSGYPKDVRIKIYLGIPLEIQKCHSSGIGGTLPCGESGLSGEVHNETLGLMCILCLSQRASSKTTKLFLTK